MTDEASDLRSASLARSPGTRRGQAPFGSGASPRAATRGSRCSGGGPIGCQDSNFVRAMPLCRMIERSVPMASSW